MCGHPTLLGSPGCPFLLRLSGPRCPRELLPHRLEPSAPDAAPSRVRLLVQTETSTGDLQGLPSSFILTQAQGGGKLRMSGGAGGVSRQNVVRHLHLTMRFTNRPRSQNINIFLPTLAGWLAQWLHYNWGQTRNEKSIFNKVLARAAAPVPNDSLLSRPRRPVLLFAAFTEVSTLGSHCHHSTALFPPFPALF